MTEPSIIAKGKSGFREEFSGLSEYFDTRLHALIRKLLFITVSIEDTSRNPMNVTAEQMRNSICPKIHGYLPVLKSMNVPESSSLGQSEMRIRYVSAVRGRK
jgi:hypothetical protein